MQAILLFLFLALVTSHSPNINGCASYRCTSTQTGLTLLPLKNVAPDLSFTHSLSVLPGERSPGCISNEDRVVCFPPLAFGTENSSVSGAFSLLSNGTKLYELRALPGLDFCHHDSTFWGFPLNLGIMAVNGDIITFGTGAVSYISSTGDVEWSQVVEGLHCPATHSPISITNSSTLCFYRDGATLFTYFPDGVPNAALVLRANSSATAGTAATPPHDFPVSSGLLVPLAQVGAGTLRTLYVTRFYICSNASASNYCSGVEDLGEPGVQDPVPSLLRTGELRLVAMAVTHTGSHWDTNSDPRRMILPWANLGPPLLTPKLPSFLRQCLPEENGPKRERLSVSPLIPDSGFSLLLLLSCYNHSTGLPSGPAILASYTVALADDKTNPGGLQWVAEIPLGPLPPENPVLSIPPLLSLDPRVTPPAEGGDPVGDVVWVSAQGEPKGGTDHSFRKTPPPGGELFLTAFNISQGELLSSTPLVSLLRGSASECPENSTSPILHALPFSAPPHFFILPVTFLTPTTTSHSPLTPSHWVIALDTSNARKPTVAWCRALDYPFQGQLVLASANGTDSGATRIIGVTEKGVTRLIWDV